MNRDKVYRNSLITCTVMLIVCIILKLFGVPWFDLNTGIPLLKEIDEMVMSSNVLSFIYSFTLLFINSYMICIISFKKQHNKGLILYLSIFCIIDILMKTYINLSYIYFLFDFLGVYIVCLLSNKDDINIKEYSLVIILNILYQGLSLFIRNLGYGVSIYTLTENVLLSVDYYIMLFMTYIYLKKGGITLCSTFLVCFSSLRKQLCTMRSKGLKHYLTNKKESD